MIEHLSTTLTRITKDDDHIIDLMKFAGIYEQMIESKKSKQDVLLIGGDHLFVWSIDEYFYYHSVNRKELDAVAFMFYSSAYEIENATRH